MSDIYYALGLHMHQPPENLQLLFDHNHWEAEQIIRCYDRAADFAQRYKDGCFHVGFSGILLEQFQNPRVVEEYKKFIDIPAMLANYRKAKNVEIIGMGYYHPVFPLIPPRDWKEQLQKGRDIIEKLFGQKPKGFWPSEMAFCMEMIPAVKEAGYEYIIVDHVHVKPTDEKKPLDCFKPYLASFNGIEITIIPRNRDLSNAQESGLNPDWFISEVNRKIAENPNPKLPRLVTTWSDGENGGWFRQIDENAGFWGYFYAPLMDKIRAKESKIQPIKLSEYIKKFPAKEYANVRTGAWNVGSTSGYDFAQWAGSESQKKAIQELFEVSNRYWKLTEEKSNKSQSATLTRARQLILDAETSCYLFWGDAWIPKIYEKLNAAKDLLK